AERVAPDCAPRPPVVHPLLEVPLEMHHPNAIAHWRVTVVLPVVLTTQPYKPRRRRSYATG
ncbi:MAG TPA: hypothetical protein VFB73_05180, partial [Chloroflexota bacterium]|nr:hypothetical protein [Chloroflexota bacterium]